jgi:hypothetical protein
MLLPPESTLFVGGDVPALLLAGAPFHDVLPVVTATDGAVPRCDGWSIVPKVTLCVVDGPGQSGCVIPSLAAPVSEPGDMFSWCAAADGAGGVVVLSLDELPDELDWNHLLTSGTSRGGFLPLLTADA